jgi:transposase
MSKLIPVVKRMRERFRLREITVVADRGMVRQATLEAFEKSDPPVRYIIGVRMRRQKEVNTSVLGSRARWFESVPERSNAKDPAPLKVKEVWVKERRYIVCLNEEERRKDAHDREAIVAHLKEQLHRGDKSLVGNKGYRRYLKVEGSGHFVIDEKQVKAEERYDGIWLLRTNTVYNTETVAHVYKALWTVEDIIRTSKSILETHPIYHKRDETIRGHVFCSFLALLLKQELESRMKRTELEWEWKEVIRGWMLCSRSKPTSRADVFYSAASLRRTLRKRSAPRAWRYRLLCGNSSDSVQTGNVVPRHFRHYVSPSTPTI